MYKSYIVFMFIDKNLILCREMNKKILFFYHETSNIITSEKELNNYIKNICHLKEFKNSSGFLHNDPLKKSLFYYSIIDVTKQDVVNIPPCKCFDVCQIYDMNYGEIEKEVIEHFFASKVYKDLVYILKTKLMFRYYSEESKSKMKEIFGSFKTVYQSDRPDIIVETNDERIIYIEQFDFDASKKTKKGSKGLEEQFLINKEIENHISKDKKLTYTTSKKMKLSLDFWFESFKSGFISHYKNISEYDENVKTLSNKDQVVRGFLIVDKTLLGVYSKNEPFYLFQLKEFWDFLEDKKIDFVLYGNTLNDDLVYLTKADRLFFEEKKQLATIENANVYFFENPHVTGFCIPLNKEGPKILEEYTD